MPPRYPFARSQPSSSLAREARGEGEEDPIVVTASGVQPNSPANSLGGDSPSNLRARLFSPRSPLARQNNSNDDQAYSSPTRDSGGGIRSRILSLGKGRAGGVNGGRGWMKLESDSPTKDKSPLAGPSFTAGNLDVPRYDHRGPTRNKSTSSNGSYASGYGDKYNYNYPQTRYANGGSSTEDDGQLYVPVMNYSTSNPSYSPFDPDLSSRPGSIYSQTRPESRFSYFSRHSDNSASHLRKVEALEAEFDNYSITSKGGPKHLDTTFRLPSDPRSWSNNDPEPDDELHDPSIMPKRYAGVFTPRGLANIGCLLILFIGIFMLFGGYPLISYYTRQTSGLNGAYNLGGINSTGQVGVSAFTLIDADTPESAYTHTSLETGDSWDLVFSDEFNQDGRTFYNGDDPFWEAADLHYWQTNNLEWYDPRTITTKNGSLVITLSNTKYNGMDYMGGMLSTWNRFCFTGGYVEVAVSLPGKSSVTGLWPAVWTMGNLGRAGYGGTLEGMWPYSYDSCDVGTLPNQTLNGEPEIALKPSTLSYLPGQRLSRCTCPSDTTHPGPKHSDGTFKGRAAPEIDMFEATVDPTTKKGEVSQSAQWAPFNPNYNFINDSNADYQIYQDSDETWLNTYLGGVYQQATSALSKTNQKCYTGESGCKSVYAFEYEPGTDGYVTWVSDAKKTWTVRGAAMAANSEAQVGARAVTEEPMYLIMNLGISENFGAIDYDGLKPYWPFTMEVDYVRVYQDPKKKNVGCDPTDMPTASYIAQFTEAYNNPNISTFDQITNAVKPKNKLTDTC